MENNKRWLRCLAAAGVLAVGFIAAYPVVKDRIHGGRMKEVSLSELQSTAGGEETGGGVKGSEETNLSKTVNAALKQIEEKEYGTMLTVKGVPKEKIRTYGFAFCGKKVLIGRG